jgi:hypothetical protein
VLAVAILMVSGFEAFQLETKNINLHPLLWEKTASVSVVSQVMGC